MREYFAAWGDREAYAVSHVGWGMNTRARWDALAMYDKRDVNGTEQRAFAGNFLYSTGANEVAGRHTLGHFDLPFRHCTVELDGKAVVKDGKLVGMTPLAFPARRRRRPPRLGSSKLPYFGGLGYPSHAWDQPGYGHSADRRALRPGARQRVARPPDRVARQRAGGADRPQHGRPDRAGNLCAPSEAGQGAGAVLHQPRLRRRQQRLHEAVHRRAHRPARRGQDHGGDRREADSRPWAAIRSSRNRSWRACRPTPTARRCSCSRPSTAGRNWPTSRCRRCWSPARRTRPRRPSVMEKMAQKIPGRRIRAAAGLRPPRADGPARRLQRRPARLPARGTAYDRSALLRHRFRFELE